MSIQLYTECVCVAASRHKGINGLHDHVYSRIGILMVVLPALLDRLNRWWDWLSHAEVLMATSTVLVLSWMVTWRGIFRLPSLTVPLHTKVLCRGERGIKLT